MNKPATADYASMAAVSRRNAILLAACCFGFVVILVTFSLLPTSNALANPDPQSGSTSSDRDHDQPVELGNVHWKRDLDGAVADSKKQDKPIALLFQEVPG